MRYASKLRLFTVLMALIWPAHAAIEVAFIEDAPKDRFVIGNTGGCTVEDLRLVIDLGPSAGGLYFDTSSAGAGVQVFQPFEAVNGAVRLVSERGGPGSVEDGQNSLEVQITRLAQGARVEFTIDVDDSVVDGLLGQSRVASTEIAGARVRLKRVARPPLEGVFDATGRAVTPAMNCGSGKAFDVR